MILEFRVFLCYIHCTIAINMTVKVSVSRKMLNKKARKLAGGQETGCITAVVEPTEQS